MKYTNNHSLPKPLYNALSTDNYSRGKADISITGLIGPPKPAILARDHHHEIEVDVMDRVWSLFGTTVHKILEEGAKGEDKYVAEERVFTELDGWVISGGIDIQYHHDCEGAVSLTDWKTTSAWAVMHEKFEWAAQLNAYRWLVERAKGVKVGGLQIGAIIRDWSKREAERNPDSYPPTPIVMIDIPMWDMLNTHSYILSRLEAHQDAQRRAEWGEALPPCSDGEMWAREESWAVYKPGAKRASRVFDNLAQAKALSGQINGRVEHRKGERVRCQSYCAAAPWCEQHQAWLLSEEKEDVA